MLGKLRALCAAYREQLLYLIFGGLTTAVDFAVSFSLYYLFATALEESAWLIHLFDGAAWVAAVTFAFVTNRIWVFRSKRRGFLPVMGELVMFAGGRVLTFLMQEAVILMFFTLLGLNKYAVRVAAAILVIVANYFISKLWIFKKKED